MPKKTGVIVLIVFVLVVFVTSFRINTAHIFNKSKQKEKMTKEISDSRITSEPILEAQNFIAAEDENSRPDAGKISQKLQIQDDVMGYRLKSKNRTKQVQAALKKAGFYKGDVDGKSGLQTKKAIKAFQRTKDLTPDGIIGVRTWEELAKILKN
jgi:murein L,D-transpeptidase YcbB/YkuD